MVSGLVTSPWDQLRIFSGEARLMRMESKSVMVLPRSNGLERYKVSSCGYLRYRTRLPGTQKFLFRSQPQPGAAPELRLADELRSTRASVRRRRGRFTAAFKGFDQLNIQAERLQLADQHVE